MRQFFICVNFTHMVSCLTKSVSTKVDSASGRCILSAFPCKLLRRDTKIPTLTHRGRD